MGGTVKIPKHIHEKTLMHPISGSYICWCKYPFGKIISQLKEKMDDVTLVAIYEVIQRRRKGKDSIPLDNFIKVIE